VQLHTIDSWKPSCSPWEPNTALFVAKVRGDSQDKAKPLTGFPNVPGGRRPESHLKMKEAAIK
jgi:hypothetical protein